MSVQSEIDRIITAVGNAYSKVSQKGGTVPASQTVANLATAIASIPAGSTPSLQSKSVTYTSNGTNTITPDEGYDGLSSVNVTVDVSSGGGGTTIPGIVELFTTSGLHYSTEYEQTINITFSAWPNYFGVYCTDGEYHNIFIGPSVYFGNMAGYVNIKDHVIINDVNFNAGFVSMQIYKYVNYYFLSDVEMTINTQ